MVVSACLTLFFKRFLISAIMTYDCSVGFMVGHRDITVRTGKWFATHGTADVGMVSPSV